MSVSLRGIIYNTLIHTALPIVAAITWRKCRKASYEQPLLKDCFAQKFGKLPAGIKKGGILIHAVSLGETRSVLPLISELQNHYPDLPLTLTHGSVRGAKQLVNNLPAGIEHSFLPLDYPFAVKRFLKQVQPKVLVIVETEIWPNLIQACNDLHIPILLVNARLKHSSMQSYQKYGGQWLCDKLNQIETIACQFKADRDHFAQLGINSNQLKTIGNLKFDISISNQLRQKVNQWKAQHHGFVWVAASTHEDEEALMLEAHKQLLTKKPNAVLILVPRQADRFDEVEQLLKNQDWRYEKRSDWKLLEQHQLKSDTQVLLADSVGEMLFWMGISDAAFVGGSMVNFGGHNILEPAAWQKPVLSGPHYQNLEALYQVFIDAEAIQICDSPKELATKLIMLTDNQTNVMWGSKALKTFEQNTGALPKLLALLKPYLSESVHQQH